MEARIYKTTNLYLFLFIGNICDQDSLDIPLLARCKVNNDASRDLHYPELFELLR
jgi:hypothetical protein